METRYLDREIFIFEWQITPVLQLNLHIIIHINVIIFYDIDLQMSNEHFVYDGIEIIPHLFERYKKKKLCYLHAAWIGR